MNVELSLLFRRRLSRNSVLFKLTIWLQFFIFIGKRCISAMCEVCRKAVQPVFGVQIESDSCTHIGCFLYVQYSTEWSWITKGINTTCFLRCRPSILYFAQTFTHHCVNNVVRQSKWHSLWTVKGFSLENNDKFKKKLYMFILKIKDWITDDKWLVTITLRKAQTFQCTL